MSGMIGSVVCDYVKGNPPTLQQRIETWEVPGVDGYGYLLGALGNATGRVLAIAYTTTALWRTWYASLVTLQAAGQPVTIVNDLNESYTNCLIVHVGEPRVSAARHPSLTYTVRVEADVIIVRRGT